MYRQPKGICLCELNDDGNLLFHPDCQMHAHSRVHSARYDLIEALVALPQAAVVDKAWLENVEDLSEIDFLDQVFRWIHAYGKLATTARNAAVSMSEELEGWRTFGTLFRKLLGYPPGGNE